MIYLLMAASLQDNRIQETINAVYSNNIRGRELGSHVAHLEKFEQKIVLDRLYRKNKKNPDIVSMLWWAYKMCGLSGTEVGEILTTRGLETRHPNVIEETVIDILGKGGADEAMELIGPYITECHAALRKYILASPALQKSMEIENSKNKDLYARLQYCKTIILFQKLTDYRMQKLDNPSSFWQSIEEIENPKISEILEGWKAENKKTPAAYMKLCKSLISILDPVEDKKYIPMLQFIIDIFHSLDLCQELENGLEVLKGIYEFFENIEGFETESALRKKHVKLARITPRISIAEYNQGQSLMTPSKIMEFARKQGEKEAVERYKELMKPDSGCAMFLPKTPKEKSIRTTSVEVDDLSKISIENMDFNFAGREEGSIPILLKMLKSGLNVHHDLAKCYFVLNDFERAQHHLTCSVRLRKKKEEELGDSIKKIGRAIDDGFQAKFFKPKMPDCEPQVAIDDGFEAKFFRPEMPDCEPQVAIFLEKAKEEKLSTQESRRRFFNRYFGEKGQGCLPNLESFEKIPQTEKANVENPELELTPISADKYTTLEKVFNLQGGGVSNRVQWREFVNLLEVLGGSWDQKANGKWYFELNGIKRSIENPVGHGAEDSIIDFINASHKSVTVDLLEAAGCVPGRYYVPSDE